MAADKWQLAAMYNLAVTNPGFRTILASSPDPASLQNSIVQGGWAGQFPGAVVPLLSAQQLTAAQTAPDNNEITTVAGGAAILEGGTDAWALDYVTSRVIRTCIVQPGTNPAGESNQAPLL